MTTRILIADDHPLMRKAIRYTLEQEPDFNVVGEAEDGEQVVTLAEKLLPDLIIMDITMPKLSGLEATRKIKDRSPNIAVLVLTVHDDTEHIHAMLKVGVAGYLTKKILDDDLVNAIRATISGEVVIAAPIFHEVLNYAPNELPKPNIYDIKNQLNNRELEILKLAANGVGNRNIALKLNLSPNTVKNYLVEIFSKLNVASRTEAVVVALRLGLLEMHDIYYI